MEKNRIPKYIAIEGPIGVGKTSLAKQISQEFGHELCLEKPDENPFLNSFYENTQKYAFATQMHFVMQRSQQINMYFSDDLIEKPIVSDFIFQKEDLFAELNLSADELNIFKEIKTRVVISNVVISNIDTMRLLFFIRVKLSYSRSYKLFE